MKIIKILTAALFALAVLLPVALFNFEEGAVSQIDNRALAGDPLQAEGDLTKNVENYVNDRIGLRNEMILGYTVLNDRLFGKMVHPSYIYGEDGYVFGAGLFIYERYSDYHRQFADMVKEMQDYCDARQIPFLFVFNPAKPAVLTEYIPAGRTYNRSWVDGFFAALDERGVRYVDNTGLLKQKSQAGEAVFNQKYDANHWNDLGAYYGVNAILQELQKLLPSVHVIGEDELTVSQTLQTSLPVSEFPIHELVPNIRVAGEVTSLTGQYYSEIDLTPGYDYFQYFVNEAGLDAGAPRALVFQGSYMNGFGYKYMAAGFGEYIAIHDYQNVMDLDYYFNIFRPDCVIFEVAEYTFSEGYFSTEKMAAMSLDPTLESVLETASEVGEAELEITAEQGGLLTKLTWLGEADHAWLVMDGEYDMRAVDGGWEVTVHTSAYEAYADSLVIYTQTDDTLTQYK